jgi:ubiquitin-conjugating enzyme (huntingtin interacting protein 2)
MPDLKRIEREIRQCVKDEDASVKVEPINDNLCHLKGSFLGPEETCYEGGEFVIDIQIPDKYPFEPPKMKVILNLTVFNQDISSECFFANWR